MFCRAEGNCRVLCGFVTLTVYKDGRDKSQSDSVCARLNHHWSEPWRDCGILTTFGYQFLNVFPSHSVGPVLEYQPLSFLKFPSCFSVFTTWPNSLMAHHVTIVLCFSTEAPYSETPSSYGYDLEHSEEHRPRHDPLSFTGSPSSSPRLRSKSRSSRDTQSSGSLESTLSVMSLGFSASSAAVLHLPPAALLSFPVYCIVLRCPLSTHHPTLLAPLTSHSVMKFAVVEPAFTVCVVLQNKGRSFAKAYI